MTFRTLLALFAIAVAPVARAEIQTRTLQPQTVPVLRQFDGQVEAINAATVSGQTSGRVADIRFDVGDRVPAGAVIIRLVSEDQQGGLQQAQAALADAGAGLNVDQLELKRIQELFGKGVVSKADLDRAKGRVQSREAQVKNAEGALRRAQQQLSYTVVKAPFAGVVSERHIELGEAVNPGTPLMSGFDPDHLRVVVNIPQGIADQVKADPKARVRAGQQTLVPEKTLIYPTANPVSGTVKVRLSLPQGSHGLLPGQWVKVAFDLGQGQQLLIPQSAVMHRSQVSAVYVQTAQGLQLRNVRLGRQSGDQVAVSAGLNAGDVLVLNPLDALLQKGTAEGAANE